MDKIVVKRPVTGSDSHTVYRLIPKRIVSHTSIPITPPPLEDATDG